MSCFSLTPNGVQKNARKTPCTLHGGAGNDILYGGRTKNDASPYGNDLHGDAGEDSIYGDGGQDTLFGGQGKDRLVGNLGDDRINGGDEDDIIYGDLEMQWDISNGQDVIEGGDGNDTVFGGAGIDTYYVGQGVDTVRDDAAGQGRVLTHDNYLFTGGDKIGADTWRSEDRRSTYTRFGDKLIVVKDAGRPNRTVIEDFDFEMARTGRYLGIHLPEPEPDDECTGSCGGGGGGGAGGGIRSGTQWVKPDDGLLVRDLDGNGAIDTGRELFGDATQLPNGSLAADGFAALRALDTNQDWKIDSADAAFGELRVWQDANQDGQAQAAELKSLAELDITQIGLNPDGQNRRTFVQDGAPKEVRHVNLAANALYREFTDNPPLTAAAAALPQMRGSGVVRDLREAMSLGNGQAAALEAEIAGFKGEATAQGRQGRIDAIIDTWAATSAAVPHGRSGLPAEMIWVSYPGSAPATTAGAWFEQDSAIRQFRR